MSDKNIFKGVNTICTHVGQVKDEQYGGSVSPIYPGTSYEYIDKEIDNTMKRTSGRPVAGERISRFNALLLGIVLNLASFIILTYLTNMLAAMMAISGTLFYVLIYSIWLKKKTYHNIVIGGAAGCFPPLVGWSAVTGDLSLSAWYLFAIIFFWFSLTFIYLY